MINKFKTSIVFTIFLSLGFFACEYVEPCTEHGGSTIPIGSANLSANHMIDWGVTGNKRKIVFWFKQENFPENGLAVRTEDICTSSSLDLRLVLYNESKIESYKLLAFYPSVPPSGKILRAEQNDEISWLGAKIPRILIRLPRLSSDHHNSSWVECGLEIIMVSQGDITEDLAYLQLNGVDPSFVLSYVEF